MSAKRRIHLQIPSELERELRAVGQQHGVGLGPAIRILVDRALERDGGDHPQCRDCSAAAAALIAAEQTLLVVASILPQGRSLVAGLAGEATAAAERRLAEVALESPIEAEP